MPAVSPQEVLRGGDRLLFVGIVESVVDLQRIRGLVPATDQVSKLSAPRPQRCLIEAVVSNSCPLVGKTIRDGRFRNVYNAVVVAVARNGERLHKKIGDIVLHAGRHAAGRGPSVVCRSAAQQPRLLSGQPAGGLESAAPRSGLDRDGHSGGRWSWLVTLRMAADAQGVAAGRRRRCS